MNDQVFTDGLEQLLALRENDYQVFQAKLMPTVPPETIIGVRTPLLWKLAKELYDTPRAEAFLNSLPPQILRGEQPARVSVLEPVSSTARRSSAQTSILQRTMHTAMS